MTASSYWINQAVTINWLLTDTIGVPTNADVTGTVTAPDGSVTDLTVTNPETGSYRATFDPEIPGWHTYRLEATGAIDSATEASFYVNRTLSGGLFTDPEALASLAQVKDGCKVKAEDTSKDEWFLDQIPAAREVIEYHAGAIVAATKIQTANGGRTAILLHERANTVSSVTVNGSSWTGYGLNADAGILYADTTGSGSFPAGIGNVVIIYSVGQDVTPAAARSATVELIRHWFQNGQMGNRQAFGGAQVEPGMPATYAIPKRVLEMLTPLGANRMPGIA